MAQVVFDRAVTFPDGLNGAQGYSGVNATATTVLDLQKNGSNIGTITFTSAGSTAAFAMNGAVTFAVGDRLSIVNEDPADATLADISLTGNDKYRYHVACVTKNAGSLTFFKDAGDQTSFGQVTGTNAIPSATTKAAIGNWNHTTDRNWHGYIDFVYLWDRVLDLGARRAIQNNPYQFVKPRLSGRTYVAYGITAPTPPRGDSGKGSIVIALTS